MRFLIIFLATIGIMMQTSFAGFPDKTIRLIVPWKAGGGTDTIARGFVGAFADAAGVDVVISNIVVGAGIAILVLLGIYIQLLNTYQ